MINLRICSNCKYIFSYVSHVGLRRIILETSDFPQQLGTDLARFLLARAEANLYGRLTLAELIIMAQEVQRGVRRHYILYTLYILYILS